MTHNHREELVRTHSKELEDGCPAHLILVAKLQPSVALSQIVHLNKKEISCGRSTDVDLVLDSTKVPRMISRVHAKIQSSEEKDEEGRHKFKVVDNKSLNGIFVNDHKVTEHFLEDGDVITFGGGGNLALGILHKQEDSEFIYQIRYRTTNPNNLKRKLSGTVSVEDAEEEAKKKQKLEEELKEKERLQQLLEERQRLSEEQEKKIKEFEEKLVEKEREFAAFQERELARTAEASTNFYEQLQKINEQFEEKAKTLAEEKQKELEEQKKHALELEQRAKDVEKQVKELENAQVSANQKFEEEFTCVICQEMIMAALTLECSHSFCGVCIMDWMKKKKTCPYCNTPILKEPIRSRVLDNAIDKLIQSSKKEDRDNWENRMQRQKKLAVEQSQLNNIKALIKTAKEKGLPFLNMSNVWSQNDRVVFHKGLKEYSGEARILYCDTTGLNTNFINTANPAQLKMAVTNLGISLVGIENNSQELKRRLSKLIDGTLENMPNPQPAAAPVNNYGVKQAAHPVKHAVQPNRPVAFRR
eukprot:TRINITY_DN1172_c3_g1_i1.p1 TRINITY_DN1172_c3_g1~~TRINITY_DN1172_c3_g1_i1.p1  ORF type:complete len:566 (-),score=217.33 TRINITY_DN1172_c3_g1_i1:222-1811(-)